MLCVYSMTLIGQHDASLYRQTECSIQFTKGRLASESVYLLYARAAWSEADGPAWSVFGNGPCFCFADHRKVSPVWVPNVMMEYGDEEMLRATAGDERAAFA